jgi:hypothetical protein
VSSELIALKKNESCKNAYECGGKKYENGGRMLFLCGVFPHLRGLGRKLHGVREKKRKRGETNVLSEI